MRRPLLRHLDNPLPRPLACFISEIPSLLKSILLFMGRHESVPVVSVSLPGVGKSCTAPAVGHASSCTPHRLWQAQFTAMMMVMTMMTTVTSRFVSNLLYTLASSVRPRSSFPCHMTYVQDSAKRLREYCRQAGRSGK